MKKILVPIDFSENSRKAILYANRLASKADSKVILLNCYYIEEKSDISTEKREALEKEEQKKSLTDLSSFLATLNYVRFNMKVLHENGIPGNTIMRVISKEDIDLVVMGMNDKSAKKDNLFGSAIGHVKEHATCPLLLIPDTDIIYDSNDIICFTYLNSECSSKIRDILNWADLLTACIHCVFIMTSTDVKKKKELFIQRIKSEYQKNSLINFHIIQSDNQIYEIKAFINKYHSDLLIFELENNKSSKRIIENKIVKNIKVPFIICLSG